MDVSRRTGSKVRLRATCPPSDSFLRDAPFPLVFRRLKNAKSRTAVATKANTSKGGSVADTFSAVALDLDGEITELRSQLAQKLLLQNEQLKQLLARYSGYGVKRTK